MRTTGLLLPIFSLPSNQGIGDLGLHCNRLIDQLNKTHVKIWQILPFNPSGYGHSPYQPFSSFAGDEIYLSLDRLADDDLIKRSSIKNCNKFVERVDYESVRAFKEPYYRKAFRVFKKDFNRFKNDYDQFLKEAFWLENYATFMSLKKQFNNEAWTTWPKEAKHFVKHPQEYDITNIKDEIEYHKFLQFIFFRQWKIVKDYASSKEVSIMGDVPFYVGLDSADVWENQDDFVLDQEGYPTHVAGVPPDYFSADGQRWGNPLYDWDKMKKDGYTFWMKRLGWNAKHFDMIRIDHFRAFDTYWKIPSYCSTAREGEWILGPAYDFFDTLYQNIFIVAEDLGDIRKEVIELKDHYNLYGMKVLQFELEPKMLKASYNPHVIYYTGTHDNDTIENYYISLDHNHRLRVRRYFKRLGIEGRYFYEIAIKYCLNSKAEVVIIPSWDLLGSKDGRMNIPGIIDERNWSWKLKNNKALFASLEKIAPWIIEANRD